MSHLIARRHAHPRSVFGLCALAAALPASAYSLWSGDTTERGAGEIHLANEVGKLGELRIRPLLLAGLAGWSVPFNNNGEVAPNVCATLNANSALPAMHVNENISICPSRLKRGELSMFVVSGGTHQGHQLTVIRANDLISMSADIALQIGNSVPVRVPFYATTGVVKVVPELRARTDDVVRRMPWMKASPGELRGRLGDFDGNGWIDGTFIASGTLPAGSAGSAGEPYLMIRHFETDLPVQGVLSGNVKALAAASAPK